MGNPFSRVEVDAAVGGIRSSLAEADKIAFQWDAFLSAGRSIDPSEEAVVKHYVELAFIQAIVFLEAAGLPEVLKAVQKLKELAKKDYSAFGAL